MNLSLSYSSEELMFTNATKSLWHSKMPQSLAKIKAVSLRYAISHGYHFEKIISPYLK